MKARSLFSCILLSILVFLLLSTAAQATEYSKANTEVKAEELLKHIENGDNVALYNCSIVGELDISNINLKTVTNPIFDENVDEISDIVDDGLKLDSTKPEDEIKRNIKFYGLSDKLNVIESKVTIINSVFINKISFSNVQFNSSVDFANTNFTSNTNLSKINFNSNADFYGANFTSDTDFSWTNFNNSANLSKTNFTSSANFRFANFNNSADFSKTNFTSDTSFNRVDFNSNADFSKTNFASYADFYKTNFTSDTNFYGANFNSSANFYSANFTSDADFRFADFNGSANLSNTSFNSSADFYGAFFSNYTEIKAEKILKKIERGEDIFLVDCRIVGELDINKINLKTVPNPIFDEFMKEKLSRNWYIEQYRLSDKLSIIESKVTIINSVFADNISFSNVLFNSSVDFTCTNFTSNVSFSYSNFNSSAKFSGAEFTSNVSFPYSNFNSSAKFSGVKFNSGNVFKKFQKVKSVTFSNGNIFVKSTKVKSGNIFAKFRDVIFPSNDSVVEFADEIFKNHTVRYLWTSDDSLIFSSSDSVAEFRGAIFEGDAYFSDAFFKGDTFFSDAIFKGNAHFSDANFYHTPHFDYASFSGNADFSDANFNYIFAHFSDANFSGNADFSDASFSITEADFGGTNFSGNADFSKTNFNYLLFWSRAGKHKYANFNGKVNFVDAKFNNPTYFMKENFNTSSNLHPPDTSENIITMDGKTCEIFMTAYNNEARYADSDNIYYNFRKFENESLTGFSLLIDILSLVTCGYGTKFSYTLLWAVFFIIFFAIIYKNPSVSLVTKNQKIKIPILCWKTSGIYNIKIPRLRWWTLGIYKVKIPILCWKTPGIYRLLDNDKEKSRISFLESLYFSISIFTRLGPEDWQQEDKFRKWVVLEGVLGWFIFALVSVTLMKLFIR